MQKVLKHRTLREEEMRRQKLRTDIALVLQRMVSRGDQVMPCLSEFRALPIVRTLQGIAGDLSVEEQIGTTLAQQMLKDQLETWRENARVGLEKKLRGTEEEPEKKTKQKKKGKETEGKIRLVERVDARFSCGKCKRVSKKYDEDGCMDFAGVCAHVCPEPDKQKRKKITWSVEQFFPEVMVSVVNQPLRVTNPGRRFAMRSPRWPRASAYSWTTRTAATS